MTSPTRLEHDLLGEKAVPADAYYGVQTARGLENFHISGVELRLYPNVIKAFAMVKLAAARANFDCGQFSAEILKGIEGACQELIDGKLHDQFRLDVFQGGAGTSTNMNANEVIANRALELMGHEKGEYEFCSPHDHVNGSQSTNDAYPTALHVGMSLGNVELVAAMKELIAAFRAKGKEFASILKMGRTQLQDAVPMTLGQEFEAFAETLAGEVQALERIQNVLCEVNMGATAIGTGLNAPKGYAEKCTAHLAEITGSNTLSWSWPPSAAIETVRSLPITRKQTMLTTSGITGLTLPGMIDEPGCFAGRLISRRPQRGPDDSSRRSLQTFDSLMARLFMQEE